MQPRWFLSQFFQDDALNQRVPVCYAYGGQYQCPVQPATDDGWALVQMLTTPHQVEATKEDPRVLVMPLVFDPSPLPQQVIDAYASWGAVSGMSLGALLAKLAETEPRFGLSL